MAVSIETSPAHGTTTIDPSGTIRYVPAVNYNGADSFVYRVTDPSGAFATATVSLTVTPVNDAPVAAADSYSVDEDVPLTVGVATGVLLNDTDVEQDAVVAVLITGPAHGALTLNADGSFTYLGAKDYNGADSFAYRAFDGSLYSGAAVVTLTVRAVNDAPVALNDEIPGREDTLLSGSVTTNDSDVDRDPLTVVLLRAPQHGALTLAADGTFTYVPTADFNGDDTFTYRLSDGLLTADAAVLLRIVAVPDAPRTTPDDFMTSEDEALSIDLPGVLANDMDPDGDPITAVSWTTPLHGTLSSLANGGFRYVPNANFNGTDAFTYVATDGGLSSEPTIVTITVLPVNDAPTASDQVHTIDEDTVLTVSAADGLLAGAFDVEGAPLTMRVTFFPLHGTLDYDPATGAFSYVPDANYNGIDRFEYRVSDGELWSDVALVTIDITPVNDPPTAGDDSYTMTAGTTLTIAAPGVLTNDLDDSGTGLTAVLATNVSNGTLTLNANGSFTYTTTLASGTDSFTYGASDGTVTGAPATVAINVTAAGTGGGTPSSGSFNGFTAPKIVVFDFDSYNTKTAGAIGSQPSHGKLVLRGGTWYYFPEVGYRGSDKFTIGGKTFQVEVLSSLQGDY